MTRINLVDPAILTNKHLLAEYKEITRPFNKVLKRIENGTMDQVNIPTHYVLGTGHETFFFDKLKYLLNRYNRIYGELVRYRGYNLDVTKFHQICNDLCNKLGKTPYWNEYIPSPEEIYLNMSRLCKRSNIESVLNELKEK